ncbi:MAG: putative Histidine kinase [Bacteroidetes bacterium]|jgi:two-component system sensor histidine kinase VicK|nr:putative Histidine kinase [Bacteroidota bacterium]
MEKVVPGSANPNESASKQINKEVTEFENFYEHAILPLHCVDENGIVVWANHAEFDFLGYSKEEYINKHLSFFHADDIVTADILDRLSKQQQLVNYYARLRCKSGEIKHVLINSNAFIKDGKFSHTRCFTTDITALKKEEIRHMTLISELQEKNTRLLWKVGSVQRGYY